MRTISACCLRVSLKSSLEGDVIGGAHGSPNDYERGERRGKDECSGLLWERCGIRAYSLPCSAPIHCQTEHSQTIREANRSAESKHTCPLPTLHARERSPANMRPGSEQNEAPSR